MTTLEANKIFSFFKQLDNYQDSDSHKFFLFLRDNRTLLSICADNYRDLTKILKYHDDEDIREKFWNSDSTFRFKLQKKIIRLLSNYLSSLFAVVDYSRNTLIKYLSLNDKILERYNQRKKEDFANNPIHRFIQDLRNYTSHNTYIKVGSEFSYHIEWSVPRKSIYVEKSEILKWDGWKSESRSFINSQEEKIRLNDILREHFMLFANFQNWVFLQLLLVDLKKTEKFIADIKEILYEANSIRQGQLLIFKASYVRYIDFVYRKALRTT